MDMLISGIIGFAGGFAVALILATLRNWHELDQHEESSWRMLRGSAHYIDELVDEKQDLRDRLAAEIWRNRQLERRRDVLAKTASDLACKVNGIRRLECQYRSAVTGDAADDEASWRTSEIERQITAWEKL